MVFFDQDVMNKISKKGHKHFQDNVYQLTPKITNNQILTPFSLLEFLGIQAKDTLHFNYKCKTFYEYKCSYKELNELKNFLKEKIRAEEKIQKSFLIEKLLEKKDSKHLNQTGKQCADGYINNIDFLYENLIHNLYLDCLSQINTSKFSLEEKDEFYVSFCTPLIIKHTFNKQTTGGFRMVKKTADHIRKETKRKRRQKGGLKNYKDLKEMCEILERLKLKPIGDLVDCELIHLAFFGKYCSCYTTDKKDIIIERLKFYCEFICFIERYFYEYLSKRPKSSPERKPEWKPGKVFILDKKTGEKITKISIAKIYENIKKSSNFY